jgi:hypothetical protein
MSRKTYSEKLKDPRWQRKRLEILNRDNWTCVASGHTDETLVVHHMRYHGSNPWDTPNEELETVCEQIHDIIGEFAHMMRKLVPNKAFSAKDLLAAIELAVEQVANKEHGGDQIEALRSAADWKFKFHVYVMLVPEPAKEAA